MKTQICSFLLGALFLLISNGCTEDAITNQQP